MESSVCSWGNSFLTFSCLWLLPEWCMVIWAWVTGTGQNWEKTFDHTVPCCSLASHRWFLWAHTWCGYVSRFHTLLHVCHFVECMCCLQWETEGRSVHSHKQPNIISARREMTKEETSEHQEGRTWLSKNMDKSNRLRFFYWWGSGKQTYICSLLQWNTGLKVVYLEGTCVSLLGLP